MKGVKINFSIGEKLGVLIYDGDAETFITKNGAYRRMCYFLCQCGNRFICNPGDAKSSHTRSCGCLRNTSMPIKHGMARKTNKLPKEYYTWTNMIERCRNKKIAQYKDYGGRGITVCARWRNSFLNFYNDMGKRPTDSHSIDRIDVNGNYEPSNCRWATMKQQMNNKQDSRFILFNGVNKTVAEWSDIIGIHRATVLYRLNKKMPVDKILYKGHLQKKIIT